MANNTSTTVEGSSHRASAVDGRSLWSTGVSRGDPGAASGWCFPGRESETERATSSAPLEA